MIRANHRQLLQKSHASNCRTEYVQDVFYYLTVAGIDDMVGSLVTGPLSFVTHSSGEPSELKTKVSGLERQLLSTITYSGNHPALMPPVIASTVRLFISPTSTPSSVTYVMLS